MSFASRKRKGIQAERELLTLLWASGWAAVRVAGSGSSRFPSPDIVASNGVKVLALECKVVKTNTKFFPLKEIQELLEFSKRFKAEPWIAVKHFKQWFFVRVEHWFFFQQSIAWREGFVKKYSRNLKFKKSKKNCKALTIALTSSSRVFKRFRTLAWLCCETFTNR